VSIAMKHRTKTIAKSQRGFALLMVMFLTTILLLLAIAAAPYVRTEGRREKEEEMIWRGKQYVRGIKLYYRKTGRFPTSVDDLTKPKLGSLRFMRQAYKDPMNKEDGSWRFIYVGPNGQLIGSLKPPQTFQIPGVNGAQPGTPAGANPQQTVSFGASGFGQQPPAQPGAAQGQPGQPGANPNAATTGQPGSAGQSTAGNNTASDDAANAAPSGLFSADNALVGGNIIGVGSKTNKASFLWFEKAKNYRQFEFVWDPSVDSLTGRGIGVPPPNAPLNGTSPIGNSSFSTGSPNNNMNGLQNSPTGNTPLQAPPQQ
jgi:hypothetical protein